MVTRAQENARRNGIDNARFYKADLSGDIVGMSQAREGFDLVLLDPARPGALEVMSHVVALSPNGWSMFPVTRSPQPVTVRCWCRGYC